MRRFFFHPDARKGDQVLLSESESRHITRSLRLHVGSQVELLDGSGARYLAEITSLDRLVSARILTTEATIRESAVFLHLNQAMLKRDKMDFVVEKCTELGADSFTPFYSSRCQRHAEEEKTADKRQMRWQRIVESACKQCSRPRPMQIAPATSLTQLCGWEQDSNSLRLLFWEEEKETTLHDLPDLKSQFHDIHLILGPEGGFSRDEVGLARDSGCRIVSLGPQILRAETATIAAISVVRYLTGSI